jgi:hypothetical protein
VNVLKLLLGIPAYTPSKYPSGRYAPRSLPSRVGIAADVVVVRRDRIPELSAEYHLFWASLRACCQLQKLTAGRPIALAWLRKIVICSGVADQKNGSLRSHSTRRKPGR